MQDRFVDDSSAKDSKTQFEIKVELPEIPSKLELIKLNASIIAQQLLTPEDSISGSVATTPIPSSAPTIVEDQESTDELPKRSKRKSSFPIRSPDRLEDDQAFLGTCLVYEIYAKNPLFLLDLPQTKPKGGIKTRLRSSAGNKKRRL
ncbi:hypothetical protein G9A89_007244 [Geosiphon pyriformis]|nr:hypothetical protein G9A89_007244 [Geosiphon pyriformis]